MEKSQHNIMKASFGLGDKFDLVIKGGEVLDPSQSLRATRDVGIKNGVIVALDSEIPPDRCMQVIDASGKLVTPGLIDLHAHVYPQGSAIGLPMLALVMPGPIIFLLSNIT